jgi:hypothetical protein
VIEDVQTTFWPQFGGSTLDGGGTMQLARAILEHLHHAEIEIVQPGRQVTAIAKSIRSFRAYHNIFVIEKGDNTEPSNFDFRLDNVDAARAVRTIKDELARSPTPALYANLIDIHLRGRDLREAWNLVEAALGKWPAEPAVLFAAYSAAMQSGNRSLEVGFLRQLAALEPENAELQGLLARTEAGAASVTPP